MTANIETPQTDTSAQRDAPEPISMREYVDLLSRLVAMQHAPAHDPTFEWKMFERLYKQVDYEDTKGLREGNPHLDALPLGAPYDALDDVFLDAKKAVAQLELVTHHRNEAIQTLLRVIQQLDAIDTYHAIISAPPVMPEPIEPIKKKRVV
jgi:hypothetical protein